MNQRMNGRLGIALWALLLAIATLRLGWLYAQEAAPAPATKPADAPQGSTSESVSAADELALQQSKVADKYKRLEDLMLKMASMEEASNPRRAALLRRALEQSKERLTKAELDAVVKLLNQKQLKRALDGQGEVQTDLKALLELLMSEDRSDRLKSEQARIKEYIKEVERMIRLQKSLQGQTEGDGDAKSLAKQQGELAGRAEDLAKKIKENEEGAPPQESKEGEKAGEEGSPEKGSEGKNAEGKSSEGKSGKDDPGKGDASKNEAGKGDPSKEGSQKSDSDKDNPKKGEPGKGNPEKDDPEKGKQGESPEGKNGEDKKPGEEEGKKAEDMPGESPESEGSEGEEGQNKPSEKSKGSKGKKGKDGKPSEGKSGEPSQDQQQPEEQQAENPARKRIEQAEQKMRDAQKKLEEAKRKESAEEQRQAKEELEKAKAELEEILRQMREEEIARALAALEARFRKMLEMQLKVYESTRRLDLVTAENRGETYVVQSGKLGFDERKIAIEAQKALTLLKEEGSSIAFPATVEQIHEDMNSVADRLAETKVDDITIGYEEDIIAALEEMIDALQKAQQDQEKKKQQQDQQQQQQQQEDDQPLVDEIAELKMIKSLQERVNKRTTRYARLLEDDQDPVGQANAAELVDALKKLGDRQREIFRITRDLVLGKNN